MAMFTIEDVLLKSISATVPIAQVLIWFGLAGAIAFACGAKLNQQRLFSRDVLSRPMLLRFAFEIVGRLFYVLAIALTPLSAATVILQATPVFVVAGAALVFGEKTTWLRWAAVLLGLIGVVIVVRPDANGFSFLSILAVVGMLGFAARDLASRAAPFSLATSTLGFYGFLSIVAAGAIYSIREQTPWVSPSIAAFSYLIGAVLVGAVAYSALMKAMRTGEVSAVTPFRYTRLIFGVGMGVLLFQEHLYVSMFVGCLLIASSGLVVLLSQTKK